MLLPFKCGIPKQLFFWKRGSFGFSLHFGAILHAQQWWGGQALDICHCACSSAEGHVQPIPQVAFLCTDGVKEMGQYCLITSWCHNKQSWKHLCAFFFFFSVLMHASIFLAEENQLMQAYAKSRKKRLFDQEMGLSLAVGFLSLCYWNKIYNSD